MADSLKSQILRYFYDRQDESPFDAAVRDLCAHCGVADVRKIQDVLRLLLRERLIYGMEGGLHAGGGTLLSASITEAGIEAVRPTRPQMNQSEKLKALLQAVADGEDINGVGSFKDKWERVDMIEDAKTTKLLDVLFTEDGTALHPRLLPRGRAVLEGTQPGPYDPPPTSRTNIFNAPVYGQVGDHNTQYVNVNVHLQTLAQSIVDAEMPVENKRSALQRLHGLASDGTIGNAAGVASFIMSLLEKLPPM